MWWAVFTIFWHFIGRYIEKIIVSNCNWVTDYVGWKGCKVVRKNKYKYRFVMRTCNVWSATFTASDHRGSYARIILHASMCSWGQPELSACRPEFTSAGYMCRRCVLPNIREHICLCSRACPLSTSVYGPQLPPCDTLHSIVSLRAYVVLASLAFQIYPPCRPLSKASVPA